MWESRWHILGFDACVYTHTHVWMDTYTRAYKYRYARRHMWIDRQTRIAWVYIGFQRMCVYTRCVHRHMWIDMWERRGHTLLFVACVYTHTHVWMVTNTRAYKYIHMCLWIHRHTDTQTHVKGICTRWSSSYVCIHTHIWMSRTHTPILWDDDDFLDFSTFLEGDIFLDICNGSLWLDSTLPTIFF